jgi:hypothetical protein
LGAYRAREGCEGVAGSGVEAAAGHGRGSGKGRVLGRMCGGHLAP